MRIVIYLFLFLLALTFVFFSGLNAQLVTVNYYIGTQQLPLSLLVILNFILGGLLGLLSGLVLYLKLRYTNRRLRNRLKLVEEELVNLRALPLHDPSH
ncbi:lipopolysaccharide assembly protein LapA domain-containing protein [Rickettsiella massiliensis]|uniref:lipopolysaccharide assembly protein LapA domain-containing protein n=1 Tax=Rickettsiella massiliensis TaxID=676517 RepID=UPI00029AA023|nr:LapA family protein [Rickettsiella massiliensis]